MPTQEQLLHQQQLRRAREDINSRRNRTHRLCVHGAVAESFVPGSEDMDGDTFRSALENMISPQGRRMQTPVSAPDKRITPPEFRW